MCFLRASLYREASRGDGGSLDDNIRVVSKTSPFANPPALSQEATGGQHTMIIIRRGEMLSRHLSVNRP